MTEPNEKMASVPLIAHKAALYCAEKRKKTLCGALAVAVGLLLGCNVMWFILWIFAR